jgi:hypothetical protein
MQTPVKRLKLNANRVPIGVAHKNPILDTCMFEVEFLDGHTASMTANAIAENLFSQVNEDGNQLQLLDEIIDYCQSANALKSTDAFIVTPSGQQSCRQTTKGWDLLIHWKDGSQTWIPLKESKETFPADFAILNCIDKEPAFAWWVPHVIKKHDAIVAKVKSKYWERTHKYGIEIPKTIKRARELDAINGNTLWWDSLCDEMTTCWAQSLEKYVNAAVSNVKTYLAKLGKTLPGSRQCQSPFESHYRPDLDLSPELKLEGHRYFQELIGILRWACKIGRVDILLEVALLSAYLASRGCPTHLRLFEASSKTEDCLRHGSPVDQSIALLVVQLGS